MACRGPAGFRPPRGLDAGPSTPDALGAGSTRMGRTLSADVPDTRIRGSSRNGVARSAAEGAGVAPDPGRRRGACRRGCGPGSRRKAGGRRACGSSPAPRRPSRRGLIRSGRGGSAAGAPSSSRVVSGRRPRWWSGSAAITDGKDRIVSRNVLFETALGFPRPTHRNRARMIRDHTWRGSPHDAASPRPIRPLPAARCSWPRRRAESSLGRALHRARGTACPVKLAPSREQIEAVLRKIGRDPVTRNSSIGSTPSIDRVGPPRGRSRTCWSDWTSPS